ncbi:MAG: geranylgeranyl reductase family protein [Desulfovibrionaceae bacterium]|nr:geranylgeranyl reductase family protein [Desulfovibrionaceae bacterium]
MKNSFDAVIVGCGPAGSAAARVLAGQGLDVAVLDRASFPRPKLCGGLLTWKTIQALEKTFGKDASWLSETKALEFAADRYSIFHKARPLASGRAEYPFHFVNREVFDLRLLREAEAAGARILPGRAVIGCDPAAGEVRTASGESFRGAFVIGADGANSVLRRALAVDRGAWVKNLAATIEVSLDRDRAPLDADHPLLYVGFSEAGYAWVFPNRDKLILGICGLLRCNSRFQDLFAEFLDFLGVKDQTGLKLRGHPLPYGNAVKSPARERVLLAGDAGGFVEPLFGEGIFYALTTGRYAGEAVAQALATGADPVRSYRDRLRRMIMPELDYSNRLRWVLMLILKHAGSRPLGAFVRTMPAGLAEMVHGMRSYRWLRKKDWD